ncbi:hypothetical protein SEPCBS57363_003636 [Sporothrix epigloea]|uniref:Uncharacterized protein n=1 Tax=Sporothrix epigloea TaxID=1892477 RepID=A0ABP0DMN7_9PEZI
MGSSQLSPVGISAETFGALLARYPNVIATVSEAKGAKPGQKTFAELDSFRYSEAPSIFGRAGGRAMTKADVQKLVEWKLRHGKFRPTLMKLVSSNDDQSTKTLIETAVTTYRTIVVEKLAESKGSHKLTGHVEAALAAVKDVSALKGVGPATASLLMAVHFPKTCIFFSDEAYAWLAGGSGHSAPSKYNLKEYGDVAQGMVRLLRRLPDEYGAQDVEQVAYVLMYDEKTKLAAGGQMATEATASAKASGMVTTPPLKSLAVKTSQGSRKRKEPPTNVALVSTSNGPRRSGRLKS